MRQTTLLLLLLITITATTLAQDEDKSKAIRAEEFIEKRPSKSRRPQVGRYQPVRKPGQVIPDAPPPGMVFAEVGITLWRFRPTQTGDATKELIEVNRNPTEVTLERIKEGTIVSPGQLLRFSVESLSREGYLYVINREKYSDGTLGDPLLIFPTLRTSTISNVRAGRLIYIPSATSKFEIRPRQSERKQVAEVLTIIISPKPLVADDKLGENGIRLSVAEVEAWEKQFAAKVSTTYELEGGAGRVMTEQEKAAGVKAADLSQDDPLPQTVYRVTVKPDAPVLVKLTLPFVSS